MSKASLATDNQFSDNRTALCTDFLCFSSLTHNTGLCNERLLLSRFKWVAMIATSISIKDFFMLTKKTSIAISTIVLCSFFNMEAKSDALQSQVTNENKIALVIGNQNYNPPYNLANPENDANDIKNALDQLGFKNIVYKLNTKPGEIEEAVSLFANSLSKDSIAVVFYSGHGAQLDNHNYLIPVGVNIQTKKDIKILGYDLNRLLDVMEDSENRINMIFLDACRNSPVKGIKGFRVEANGLAPLRASRGVIIGYATAPGSTADDNPNGPNGFYTASLKKYITMPGLEVETMLKYVGNEVSSVNEDQIPWVNSSFYGRFCFAGCEPQSPSTNQNQPTSSSINQNYNEDTSIQYDMILLQTSKGISARDALERLVKKGKPLNSTYLSAVDLSSAKASNAILPYAKIEWSNLFKSDFSYSDLSNISLFCTNLADANLSHANLEGAIIDGANVTRTDFSNSNIKAEQLKGTCVNFDESGNLLPKTNFNFDSSIFNKCKLPEHGIRNCLATK